MIELRYFLRMHVLQRTVSANQTRPDLQKGLLQVRIMQVLALPTLLDLDSPQKVQLVIHEGHVYPQALACANHRTARQLVSTHRHVVNLPCNIPIGHILVRL